MSDARPERRRLKAAYPDEFRDGARCAFLRKYEAEREHGGYPRGFLKWPLDRRNAWFAGFNYGFHRRLDMDDE